MKIIKTRPKIGLILPAYVRPGEEAQAVVVLDAKKDVDIDFVDIVLTGVEEVVMSNSGSQRATGIMSLKARLLGKGTLTAGRTQLPTRFAVPPTAPPSYNDRGCQRHVYARVAYTAAVHVKIPWWPDAKERFVVTVMPPGIELDDPGPSIHSTNPAGPQGKDPHLEFSLSSSIVVPGQSIQGELALGNVAFNRYKVANVTLVAHEQVMLAFGQISESPAMRYRVQVDMSQAGEGVAVPFGMKLPPYMPPSWRGHLWALRYMMEVEVGVGWGSDLKALVPVQVVPSGSTARPRSRRAPLVLGSQRVRAIWERVAADLGLQYDPETITLRGNHDDVTLFITREHRGAEGIYLIAELRMPHLGLHLDGGKASGFRRMVGGGVALGDPAWDREHYVTGRDQAQVRALMEPLAPLLFGLGVQDLADEQWVLERRDTGQSKKKLGAFAADVQRLAQAITQAREGIPVPPLLAPGEEAWQELARRIDGRVARGAMAVRGELDGLAASVVTEWSPKGQPIRTTFSLGSSEAIDDRYCQELRPGADTDALPKRARAVADELLSRCEALVIAREQLSLHDPAPALTRGALSERLDLLATLGASLRAHQGPYR